MDLKITIFLLIVAFVISLIVLVFSRRVFLSLVIFSMLGNLVLWMNIFTGSEIFYVYDVRWIYYFSLFVWPLLNIFLIYYLVRSKK